MHQLKDDDGYKYFIIPKVYFGASCESSGFFATDESRMEAPNNLYSYYIEMNQPIFYCSDNSYMIPITNGNDKHWYKQAWSIDHPKWKDIPKKEELIKSTISQEDVVAEMIISLINKQYGLDLEKIKRLIGITIDTRIVDEMLTVFKKYRKIELE